MTPSVPDVALSPDAPAPATATAPQTALLHHRLRPQAVLPKLPLAAFFLVGGLVIASDPPATNARSFPYAGYLEENGVAVTGVRDVSLTLFTDVVGTTSCATRTFSSVEVAAGQFNVVFDSVPAACFATGALFFDLAVGPAGGTLTALAAPDGTHTRMHAVPFASANDRQNSFLVGSGGRVTFDREGGTTGLFGRSTGTALIVQPDTGINAGQPVFSVRDAANNERFRVEASTRVLVGTKLDVAGATTLSSTLTTSGAATFSGGVTTNALQLTRVGTTSQVQFPSAGGANNDPGVIAHIENGNQGDFWLQSSDDWDGGGDNDRVIFGDIASGTIRHEFDSGGNAVHAGDLTVGGAVSSGCPRDMTFIAGWCIDNARANNGAVETWRSALRFCSSKGKMLCSYDALMACDELDPSTSACSTKTSDGAVLWTSTRHSDRTDFGESWRNNLMCWKNQIVQECTDTETHDYFCCTHAFTGTP